MAQQKRYTGKFTKILSTDKERARKEYCKGFGFITCDDGSGDLYVHWSKINVAGYFTRVNVGDRVSFEIEVLEDGRRRAINVEHYKSDQIRSNIKSDEKKASAKNEIKQKLKSMGFTDTEIEKGLEVYEEQNYSGDYRMDFIIEAIYNTLDVKKTQKSPYVPHLELQDVFKLQINDAIDHRDEFGEFVLATITHKHGTILKIHYDGWDDKWDTWSDFEKELHRFAKPSSISKRP
eukprot:123261_1